MSPRGSYATSSTLDDSPSASLWARFEQYQAQDVAKHNFVQEILLRYDYLADQFKREVEARERERNSSWELDRKVLEDRINTLQTALERDPFIIVLIDGDGMHFQDELVRAGEAGGRQAAANLNNAILSYIQQDVATVPMDFKIVCRIYANVRGLAEALVRAGTIDNVGTFEEFTRGFTRGRTLFDFVDVGPGKDRADEKLMATFKLYLHDFHCRQIFLGCSHDNGYARHLEDLATDSVYLSRITLLEGVPFEKELLTLPFNTKKLDGVFRDEKLYAPGAPLASPPAEQLAKSYQMIAGLPSRFPPPRSRESSQNGLMDSPIFVNVKPSIPRTPSASTLASNEDVYPTTALMMKSWAAKAAAPPPTMEDAPAYKPANRDEIIARNRSGQRIDPPCRDYDKAEVDRIKKLKMCNVHFLRQECPYGDGCTHRHEYKPTAGEIATLRLVARMAPCQNGSRCHDIKCIYGHRCPAPMAKNPAKVGSGLKPCIFGETCKFALDLHNVDCNVVKTLVVR